MHRRDKGVRFNERAEIAALFSLLSSLIISLFFVRAIIIYRSRSLIAGVIPFDLRQFMVCGIDFQLFFLLLKLLTQLPHF
jgi:hypothetical protein